MKLLNLINLCNQISPFELQEAWDNSGLIVGDPNQEYKEIVLSLECDIFVANSAPKGSAIIVHHPLIFSPLKKLDFSSYPANILNTLIQKRCALIALHTNFDKTHLGRFVAEEVLGWKEFEQDGYLIHHTTQTTLAKVKSDLIDRGFAIRSIVDGDKPIRKITLCTGSGGSLAGKIGSDLIITGDLKYHEAVMAQSLSQSIIDIGHFESERYFAMIMQRALLANKTTAIIINSKNPFLPL